MYASMTVSASTLRFRILRFLSRKSPASIKEIYQTINKDRRHVRDKLQEMERRGEVYSQLTWEVGPNRYFYQVHKYWITQKGMDFLKVLAVKT